MLASIVCGTRILRLRSSGYTGHDLALLSALAARKSCFSPLLLELPLERTLPTPTAKADMTTLPADWSALCMVIFLLGLRHGFDADHLATIDGLTRQYTRQEARYSGHCPRFLPRHWPRYCGALLSLGHGAVVVGIALSVGAASARWTPPQWLDDFGAWVSIAFLLALGVTNLRAVFHAPRHAAVSLVGLKGKVFGKVPLLTGPLGVAAVGALFAVSFDTIGQSVLFAATASQHGGVAHIVGLGALFVLGMLVTDGLNGWWTARLIARADHIAALASRIMAVAVAGVSLLVAAFGVARQCLPWLSQWSKGKELLFGATVVAVVAVSYGLARLTAHALPAPLAAPDRTR